MSDEEIKAVMEACEKTRKNQVKSLLNMLQKMRICPVCGKNMAHLHKSRIYCSGACYQDRLGPHKRRTTQAPRFR